jgi:hypothetical protein
MNSIAPVLFDSLRKDAFDGHFDWLPGTVFENAWSTSGWTVPAHGTLFTGLYPSESGVYPKAEILNTEKKVLADGVVDSEGAYAWESRAGMQTDDDIDPGDAEKQIDASRAGLDEADAALSSDRDIPADVRDRLNELGYVSQ